MKEIQTILLTITLIFLAEQGIPKSNAQGLTESIEMDVLLQQQLNDLETFLPITAIITYDHLPNTNDLAALQQLGLTTHTYNMLPMVTVTGYKYAIINSSALPGVVSVWSNRTVGLLGNLSREAIGADAVSNTLGFTGRGVGVAMVDTGIDATHPDLQYGSVVTQNIKFRVANASVTITTEMQITEKATGHGTFCAGIVAGSGTASGGKYRGIAPGAHLIGLGVGDNGVIVSALDAYNWILNHFQEYNIKIVSNSWGTTGTYSPNDPVNIATKILYDAGLTVVFSAGNGGPGVSTINPYSVAPWVIGVAASSDDGTLASFSSRGTPGNATLQPTITAPGVHVESCESTSGLIPNSLSSASNMGFCPEPNLASYSCNSGTSVSAPHVSGTLALMLEANPSLTPAQLKTFIIQSATPMSGYQPHEVGAGLLNAWEAVQLALHA